MRAIVLEIDIKVTDWAHLVVKERKRIFVPDHVDILEKQVIPEQTDQLHTNDLRKHHGDKPLVAVALGGIAWDLFTILLIKENCQS